jgi:hypothetical protein
MRRPVIAILIALALGHAAPPNARAQTGGPYALTWSSIAGSGGTLSGAPGTGYLLSGSVGQPFAGPISGGGYAIQGGFWNPGSPSLVGVEEDRPLPTAFRVHPSAPNPFSAQTTIGFDLPSDQRVQMAVYDLKGKRVRVLLDQVLPGGRHSMTWAGIGDDGRPLAPGVYWITTQAGSRRDVHRTVLLK